MKKPTKKPRTARRNPTVLVVDRGPDWRIELDLETNDYAAIVHGSNYIGSRREASAARSLVTEYLCPDAS